MLWVRALFLGACTDPRLCPQHPSSELKFASAVVAVFHASRRVARSITRAMDTDTQVYKDMSMPEYASFHVRVSGMTRDEAEWTREQTRMRVNPETGYTEVVVPMKKRRRSLEEEQLVSEGESENVSDGETEGEELEPAEPASPLAPAMTPEQPEPEPTSSFEFDPVEFTSVSGYAGVALAEAREQARVALSTLDRLHRQHAQYASEHRMNSIAAAERMNYVSRFADRADYVDGGGLEGLSSPSRDDDEDQSDDQTDLVEDLVEDPRLDLVEDLVEDPWLDPFTHDSDSSPAPATYSPTFKDLSPEEDEDETINEVDLFGSGSAAAAEEEGI